MTILNWLVNLLRLTPAAQYPVIGHFKLAIKVGWEHEYTHAKAVEFDGALLYRGTFHYANTFDTFSEKHEIYETESGKFIRFCVSTGQILIYDNGDKLRTSDFGMTQKIWKKIVSRSDRLQNCRTSYRKI